VRVVSPNGQGYNDCLCLAMTNTQWGQITHFRASEFDSPDEKGSGGNMDYEFVRKLDTLRELCGFSFVIHSGYRSPGHNAELPDAVPDSAHTQGLAADIGTPTSGMRFALVRHALASGFRRVGIGKTFVHLDMDETKPQDVVWLYS